jgi:pSer/pThr/pTyr-binding forkhead associated (FHA) protein
MDSNTNKNRTSPHWGTLTSLHPDFGSSKLSAPTTILGRNPTICDIILDDPLICPQHCILTRKPQTRPAAILTDISKNGIWVNQQKIGENNSVTLEHKDQIRFTDGSDLEGGPSYVYEFNFEILKRDSPGNFGPLVSLGGEIGLGGSESQDRGEGTFGGENQRKEINIWNFEKFLGGGQ